MKKAMQRALIQYRNPKNHDLVAEALKIAGRTDLIGFDKKMPDQAKGRPGAGKPGWPGSGSPGGPGRPGADGTGEPDRPGVGGTGSRRSEEPARPPRLTQPSKENNPQRS